MSLKIGDQITVLISDLSRGGSGIAKSTEGQTIFVPYSLTGDTISVQISEIKRTHAFATIVNVITPSPDRQTPLCKVFTQCGGCQWQHVPYDIQWRTKLKGVIHSLSSAGVTINTPLQEFPAQTIWHYRNRIQMRGTGDQLGFYAERSHEIVPVSECTIARSEINCALAMVRKQGKKHEKEYKVEIDVTGNGTVNTYWNSPHAAAGFRQVNDEQNQKLIHWVQKTLSSRQPIYDLYGGSANLSRNLAAQGIEVHCIDQSAPDNNPGMQPKSLYFYNDKVLPWLKRRITELVYQRIPPLQTPWSAIIDPPRGGMGNDFEQIMERLERLNVNTMVLVGCKTDSWARDIAKLLNRNWTVASLAVFDFFPHTPHVESTACLVNNSRNQK